MTVVDIAVDVDSRFRRRAVELALELVSASIPPADDPRRSAIVTTIISETMDDVPLRAGVVAALAEVASIMMDIMCQALDFEPEQTQQAWELIVRNIEKASDLTDFLCLVRRFEGQ